MKINKQNLVIKNLHTNKELDELETRISKKKERQKIELNDLITNDELNKVLV